jgi:hypothetical protein
MRSRRTWPCGCTAVDNEQLTPWGWKPSRNASVCARECPVAVALLGTDEEPPGAVETWVE